jgi:hypothetical protein
VKSRALMLLLPPYSVETSRNFADDSALNKSCTNFAVAQIRPGKVVEYDDASTQEFPN